MAIEMVGRDMFLRHTAGNGRSYVRSHRVWDADKFMAAQKQAAVTLNAEESDPKQRMAKVEQITEDQYLKEKSGN